MDYFPFDKPSMLGHTCTDLLQTCPNHLRWDSDILSTIKVTITSAFIPNPIFFVCPLSYCNILISKTLCSYFLLVFTTHQSPKTGIIGLIVMLKLFPLCLTGTFLSQVTFRVFLHFTHPLNSMEISLYFPATLNYESEIYGMVWSPTFIFKLKISSLEEETHFGLST